MHKITNAWFRILHRVTGDPRRNSLEHRIFNSLALFSAAANLGGLPGAPDKISFFLSLGSGILFLVYYYFSRVHSIYYSLYWPMMLTICGYLFFNILANAGSQGGAQYFMIPGLAIGYILGRSLAQRILVSLLFLSATAALFAIETMAPGYIRPYTDAANRLPDVAGNYVFVQFFTGMLVVILSRNFTVERNKSDRLLLNVLPESIAEELKREDHVTPKQYASATVLFTDFVGFTRIAERLSPENLISELDSCFRTFDQIMRERGLEKIKTIGDAYMAVGGIPQSNATHAIDACLAALDIQRFMQSMKTEREAQGQPYWELRLGLHCGDLVAGVIGEKKFAYDVWGDTVNTASRLESSGMPGRINVSASVYERTKHLFDFEYRGRIGAKNKGEIDMYFLSGIKPAYCSADGLTINEAFQKERARLVV
ncbi:MAG: adenylate/guanylate cyclase domain-containing protein [Leptospirales bacterium]|nr:adenylate/guanylate cyclase domain-containing protein [Leptospirales bacterium]